MVVVELWSLYQVGLIRQAVYNSVETWLNNTVILPILFYYVNSVVESTINPVKAPCDIFTRVIRCHFVLKMFPRKTAIQSYSVAG